jgi:hypothetical protein
MVPAACLISTQLRLAGLDDDFGYNRTLSCVELFAKVTGGMKGKAAAISQLNERQRNFVISLVT